MWMHISRSDVRAHLAAAALAMFSDNVANAGRAVQAFSDTPHKRQVAAGGYMFTW